MLKRTRVIAIFFGSLLSVSALSQNYNLHKVWETESVLSTPESAVFDESRNRIYISNFNKFPRDLEAADDFISIIDLEGNILKLEWITGLKAPTGITIYDDHLFIVERDGISTYEIKTGEYVEKFKINAPGFLNDIAIDEYGTIYFTDTSPRNPEASSVCAIIEDKIDTIASDLINRSNGLLYHNRSLLVGNSGDQYLKRIDLDKHKVNNIAQLDTGIIDGIKYLL
jgi:sugar lactone lactonase YvrE